MRCDSERPRRSSQSSSLSRRLYSVAPVPEGAASVEAQLPHLVVDAGQAAVLRLLDRDAVASGDDARDAVASGDDAPVLEGGLAHGVVERLVEGAGLRERPRRDAAALDAALAMRPQAGQLGRDALVLEHTLGLDLQGTQGVVVPSVVGPDPSQVELAWS